MQRRATIPASVVIGVAFAVAGSLTFALVRLLSMRPDAFENGAGGFARILRWQMFSQGAGMASALLIATALFWIASRLSRWQRTVVQVSAWIHLAWVGWLIANPILFELITDIADLRLLSEWVWRMFQFAVFGGLALLTVATRAWWRPHSPLVVIAAVVLLVLESVSWLPFLSSWIHSVREDHPYAYQAFWPIRELVSDGAFLLVIHALMRDTTQPLPDPNSATAWFRRAEATIIIRIVAAVLLAVVGVARVPGAAKVVFVVGPLLAVGMTLGFSWCMMSIDRASIAGMPRIRLLIGASLTAWTAGVQLMQAMGMYSMIKSDSAGSYDAEAVELWSLAGPLIGATGVVLVCSAVASFAASRGDQALRETAIARAIIHAVLVAVVVLIPFGLAKVTERGTLIMLTLLLAGSAISSLVVLAGVMRRAGDAIGTVPEIPVARLRS